MPKKNKKKEESLVSLYNEIWFTRKKVCELTGVDISWIIPGTPYWLSCFAHVLAKGKYPLMKYNKDNIMLVHPQVHFLLDFGTIEQREKHIGKESMEIWDSKRDVLLEKYNGLNKHMYHI